MSWEESLYILRSCRSQHVRDTSARKFSCSHDYRLFCHVKAVLLMADGIMLSHSLLVSFVYCCVSVGLSDGLSQLHTPHWVKAQWLSLLNNLPPPSPNWSDVMPLDIWYALDNKQLVTNGTVLMLTIDHNRSCSHVMILEHIRSQWGVAISRHLMVLVTVREGILYVWAIMWTKRLQWTFSHLTPSLSYWTDAMSTAGLPVS